LNPFDPRPQPGYTQFLILQYEGYDLLRIPEYKIKLEYDVGMIGCFHETSLIFNSKKDAIKVAAVWDAWIRGET
jgi:hypothetical protein